MKIFWICIPFFVVGCHQNSPPLSQGNNSQHTQPVKARKVEARKSDVIIPPPEEKTITDAMRRQMASRNFSSLNKYVGKYEYCDAQGNLTYFQEFLGIEIRPDGTYSRDPGKNGWDGKYSIRNNTLFLHDYSWKRRTARAKLSGKILTVYDKWESNGSLRVVKTWPIKGVHYQIMTK